MHEFPAEHEAVAEIQDRFSREFDLAKRLFEFWLHYPQEEHVRTSEIETSAILAAQALNTRSCRQFRSAIDLCARGEAEDASVIVRSLFESLVATAWILLPSVRLAVIPQRDEKGNPKRHRDGLSKFIVEEPNCANEAMICDLSRDLRARLFANHIGAEDYALVESLSNKEGREAEVELIRQDVPQSRIDEICDDIGADWFSIQTHRPWTYSGLSLAELCRVLGGELDIWRDTMYSLQSRDTHGSNIELYIDVLSPTQTRRRWFSPPRRTRGIVEAATSMFECHLICIQNEIGFGAEMERALTDFVEEHRDLYR